MMNSSSPALPDFNPRRLKIGAPETPSASDEHHLHLSSSVSLTYPYPIFLQSDRSTDELLRQTHTSVSCPFSDGDTTSRSQEME
ncbi:hypothetical protein Hanom_Chr00s102453g01804431 [Helianthus anomalus]